MLARKTRGQRIALPRELYNFITALARCHPRYYDPDESMEPVDPDDRAVLIGVAVHTKGSGYRLTRLGEALRPLFRDYASDTVPDFDLADMMATMPEDIVSWLLSSEPLVENSEGGRLFHALGGCDLFVGGDGRQTTRWVFTPLGRSAVERVRAQITDVEHPEIDRVDAALPDEARGVLGRLMAGVQDRKSFDGRTLRGLDDRGAALIDYPTPDTVRIRPECYELVRALILRNDEIAVLFAMPEDDRLWFLNKFTYPPSCKRELLFVRLGWVSIKKRGARSYWTERGKALVEYVKNPRRTEDDPGVELLDADDEFDILPAHSPAQAALTEDFDII